jgi:hypothetical protein
MGEGGGGVEDFGQAIAGAMPFAKTIPAVVEMLYGIALEASKLVFVENKGLASGIVPAVVEEGGFGGSSASVIS